ncbi:MAG: DUF6474 family protein [Mycobacteriaceae bacterium]
MALLKKNRNTRATRRAEARALKTKAKLEARLAARNERRKIKAAARSELKVAKTHAKTQKKSDKASLKIAKEQQKAIAAGKIFSVNRIKRTLTVSRLLVPVVIPVAYRAAISARGYLDTHKARKLGVSVEELSAYTGYGAQFNARITGSKKSLEHLLAQKNNGTETKEFITATTQRLTDLSSAVQAAEHMPTARRKSAHQAISRELDGIDADLLARLGISTHLDG